MKWALAIICGAIWLAIATEDYNVKLAEHEEYVTNICLARGVAPSRNEQGKLICTKPAPTWAMSEPIRKM